MDGNPHVINEEDENFPNPQTSEDRLVEGCETVIIGFILFLSALILLSVIQNRRRAH